MRHFAIISDIHGNLPAFEAVLNQLENTDVEGIVCLGDIVGYGPWPAECLDLVTRCCSIVVRGNHDDAVIDPRRAAFFNGAARTAVEWTRQQLGPLHLDALNRMRTVARFGPADEVMLVHDSPCPGPTDYIHDKQIAAIAFQGVDCSVCLVGHTHVPLVFEAPNTDPDSILCPIAITAHIPSDGHPLMLDEACRYICNPGSVGQPRDCDPRASYAIMNLDAQTFTVHRAAYDVSAAQDATRAAGLPPILADRLSIGA